jgi:FKBP-type peptidyl-prolyl cis-trans isomerase
MTHRDRASRSAGRLATLLLGSALTACGSGAPPQESSAPAPPAAAAPATVPDVPELVASDLAIGSGAEAQPGSLVTVHYTGWLYDPQATETKGKKFDSSRDAGKPFQFWLGAGKVIRGWDEGVAGMKVGGQRRLIIPSALAYGERGAGGVIPPGSALVFDVELLEVRAGAG